MLTIREATAADAPAIRRLLGEAFGEHRASYPSSIFERYLVEVTGELGDAIFYVATDDDALVGTGALHPPGARDTYIVDVVPWPAGWASLRRLAVAPTHRRRGIARSLSDARVAHARRLGATAIGLHSSFPPSQQLYRSLGWQRVPAHDFTPVPGIHVEAYALFL